ncbi:hypothetical protein [Mesoterricola silvestris]|uniref:Uncharacterized protein n=1 Tax=Mesoterricola silvestris TaxID=2927979 RepID=A0AA48GM17_9BACT|nr:hypothetical protein [Mesoterricola silvestris]BDU72314.1 hypothetical protein METEAL_14880 [Mesoterricola silvestris]
MSERLLRVTAPHFVAGAVWTFKGNAWVCTEAAPILRWMVGLGAVAMAHRRPKLERKGWRFEWL